MSATGSLSTKSKASAPLQCKWSGCEAYKDRTEFVGVDELARHVRMNHVEPLESQDVVVCQWEGCKVYNVPSSSIQWLKRHVQQAHTKDRPFKCIMNGCNMSFNSREALQRHVNRHLEPTVAAASSPVASLPQRQDGRTGGKISKSKRTLSSPYVASPYAPVYQLYPNTPPRHYLEIQSDSSYDSSEDIGRISPKKPLCLKVRIPRRAISLSSLPLQGPTPYNDVWDHKMMSVIRLACNQLSHNSVTSTNLSITLKATVLGQRCCASSTEEELLVRWFPPLAEDCWIPVSQFTPQKSIPFSQISEPYLSLLVSHCFPYPKTKTRHSKRKP